MINDVKNKLNISGRYITVGNNLNHEKSITVNLIPKFQIKVEPKNWKKSLKNGDNVNKSSRNPIRKKYIEPTNNAITA